MLGHILYFSSKDVQARFFNDQSEKMSTESILVNFIRDNAADSIKPILNFMVDLAH